MAIVRVAVNHVVNDKGEMVIAIGAPGSIERAKVQWPALIERLNRLYASAYESYGKAVDEAYQMIRDAGVKGRMETDSILLASDYRNESEGSVLSLTRGIDGLPPMQARKTTTMTKKQASNWVKKNCVFAQKQELLSMVKQASIEKGVDLTERALTCHVAAIMVMASLKALAARVDTTLIEQGMEAAYETIFSEMGGRSVDAGTLASRVLENILDKADPPVRRPVRTSPEFMQSFLSAKQLAKDYLANLSPEGMAAKYHPTKGEPIGANTQEQVPQRARLTTPRPPQRPALQTIPTPLPQR